MSFYLRLSYNSNNWTKPSGFEGKSVNPGNHENLYGFGFEEWFFNPRRFKSMIGGKKEHHFAYLEPLSEFDPSLQVQEDMVLYTLKWEGKTCTRYIVSRIKKDEWRFIDREEYLELKQINSNEVLEIRKELSSTMPFLKAGLVINRFNQQSEGNDYFGNSSNEHRLWNIEILKELKILMEPVTDELLCPDWHINTFKMFKLYYSKSEGWNHENCRK